MNRIEKAHAEAIKEIMGANSQCDWDHALKRFAEAVMEEADGYWSREIFEYLEGGI